MGTVDAERDGARNGVPAIDATESPDPDGRPGPPPPRRGLGRVLPLGRPRLIQARRRPYRGVIRGAGAGLVALALFVFALRLLVRSAGPLGDLFDSLATEGMLNFVGLGWIGAYLILSGSPIAAAALTLLDADIITPLEAFGQVVGSRVGASFVVLAVGFVYYLRGRRLPDSTMVGVLAFLVTATTWIPVALLGVAALEWGWFDGLEIGAISPLLSFTENVYDPLLDPLSEALPDVVLVIAGMFLLLAALRLFDAVLPSAETTSDRLARLPRGIHSRWSMFGLGAAVTLVTLSVAVSLTLLIPLALRGAIRRQSIIPYVLGANITTFIDTLFAAAVLDDPRAGTVVLTTMIFATSVALVVLVFFYEPYARAITYLARRATQDRRGLGWFIGALVAVPVVLFLV